jgi:hypothetical protein
MQRYQLIGGGLTAIVGAALVIGEVMLAPMRAQSSAVVQPDLTCSNSSSCLEWTNTGSGHGIKGTAPSSDGIVGVTRYRSTSPSNFHSGVEGIDSSPTGSNDAGVFGRSIRGSGALGTGTIGVLGVGTTYGVFGKGAAIGVEGLMTSASSSGTAILAVDLMGTGLLYEGIDVHGNDLFKVDSAGNAFATSFTAPFMMGRQPTTDGAAVTTYVNQSSMPSLEDFGEATLTLGKAYVTVDRSFASAIDHKAGYLVFITPEGDTRGLYVTRKSTAGFEVRENQGGRSSVSFSYRIVARPYAATGARLPLAGR